MQTEDFLKYQGEEPQPGLLASRIQIGSDVYTGDLRKIK